MNNNEYSAENLVQSSDTTKATQSNQTIANAPVDSNLGQTVTEPSTVGKEFIEWAEQYWHIDKLIQPENPDTFNGKTCDYKYMRGIFIQKIDGLIKERLGLGSFL